MLSCLFDPSIVNRAGKSCWPAIAEPGFDERRCSITQSMDTCLLIGWTGCSASGAMAIFVLRFDGVVMRELGSCAHGSRVGSRAVFLTSGRLMFVNLLSHSCHSLGEMILSGCGLEQRGRVGGNNQLQLDYL